MRPIRILVSAAAVMTALIGAPSVATATSLTANDATFIMLDRASATRSLTIGGSGLIADLNISITFAKCDDPGISVLGQCAGTGSSFNGEIIFRLTSPGGVTVNLVNQGTYSGQTPGAGSQTVTFDDAAVDGVASATVVTGVFRPVGSLASFNGLEANGVWTLYIEDQISSISGDPLSYFSSSLNIETRDTSAVPEPATLSLMGLGLALAGIRLARRKTA